MARFGPTSRYLRYAEAAVTTDETGRETVFVTPARVPDAAELGAHHLRGGQRLDHLAAHYLDDPTAFWAIASHNRAMTAEAALAHRSLRIPVEG